MAESEMGVRARCEKCGRGFLRVPNDMIDHYGDPQWRHPHKMHWQIRPNEWPECGGKVKMIDAALQEKDDQPEEKR